ncbi:unnamed protein product [Durusdinium trenchii]|uniref:Uncharacterized protein n=2 Tax=Durusdinium trenchii TaxID=1381693 RepID=A0ABP0JWT1_9DINO
MLCRPGRHLLTWRPLSLAYARWEARLFSEPGAAPSAGDTEENTTESSLVTKGARVYRRTRAEHWRRFEWGIGSRFRMLGKNRFMPVHAPHPMNSVVRDDYYDSDNPSIVWNELREGWEVFWYENQKLTARPFPVKKYGLERAKVEAFQFFQELEEAGRLGQRPKIEAPQEGVFFDQRMQCWVSLFWRDGRPQSRCFSATKYGFEGSKMLAMAKQRDPVNGVLAVQGGAGTPIILKEKGKPSYVNRMNSGMRGPTGLKYK